eukprot:TRINITY_DN552_c0_g3_i1.p1 TRINITY_DN552_c0_g3~~TRINITY_DN552_c0_g3_i1.p1  ORF type:complete len:346 (+),score=99.19 TRINITY_DN552_c0_g3_i1:363-1400(+)
MCKVNNSTILGKRTYSSTNDDGNGAGTSSFANKKQKFTNGDISTTGSLIQSARTGDEKTVRRLIDEGANVNQKIKGMKSTALHFACFYNHINIVRMLVEAGCEIDCVNSSGITPLHWTIDRGYSGIAKYLIERGCTLTDHNKQGYTPLHKAVLSGNLEIVQAIASKLIDNQADNESAAAIEITMDDVEDDFNDSHPLNEKTIDIITKEYESTALHLAALHGRYEIIKYLLSLKDSNNNQICNPNSKTSRKATPLHKAASKNYTNVAIELLKHKANVDSLNYAQRTPLHLSCFNGSQSMCKVLIKYRASFSIQDKFDITPIKLAKNKGFKEIIDLIKLANNPIDIN